MKQERHLKEASRLDGSSVRLLCSPQSASHTKSRHGQLFFYDRERSVVVENECSDIVDMDPGVAQGSQLWPVKYICQLPSSLLSATMTSRNKETGNYPRMTLTTYLHEMLKEADGGVSIGPRCTLSICDKKDLKSQTQPVRRANLHMHACMRAHVCVCVCTCVYMCVFRRKQNWWGFQAWDTHQDIPLSSKIQLMCFLITSIFL